MRSYDPNRSGSRTQPPIEEGASVRERQKIFSLPDLSTLQVNVKVPETLVHRLKPGLLAQFKVTAFEGEILTGRVESIAPMADPSGPFDDRGKSRVYTTILAIGKGVPGLQPRMSADARILVADLTHVLAVPTTALVSDDVKHRLAVKTREGGIDWREVSPGVTNGVMTEVRSGLQAGEFVVLDPITLLSAKP